MLGVLLCRGLSQAASAALTHHDSNLRMQPGKENQGEGRERPRERERKSQRDGVGGERTIHRQRELGGGESERRAQPARAAPHIPDGAP